MKPPLVTRLWGPGGVRLLFGDAAVLAMLVTGVAATQFPRFASGLPTPAQVEVAGAPATTLDLARDGVSEVLGPLGATRIEVRGGRVRVLSSPCPRQACRHGGWIDAAGQTLVCLPNQVVVRLPGRRQGMPDAVSR